ncbi:MAG: divalent metal cation transporter [Pseudomonadota bacterium]
MKKAPEQADTQFKNIRIDTYIGMAVSNVIMFFIILSAALSLHAHGITNIQTSTQAAEALRPVAGEFAFGIFAMGIIGTGLLAVPVLAGSIGYAAGEALKWPIGLARKPYEAKGFYSIIAISTVVGTSLSFVGIDPIKALFWSAVINGVISVPILFVMMTMAVNADVMGEFVIPKGLRAAGWLTTAGMTLAAILLIVQFSQ